MVTYTEVLLLLSTTRIECSNLGLLEVVETTNGNLRNLHGNPFGFGIISCGDVGVRGFFCGLLTYMWWLAVITLLLLVQRMS